MSATTSNKTTVRTKKAEHLKIDSPVITECHGPVFKQNYFLISFISPEDNIRKRSIFELNKFLYHDVNKQIIDTTSNVVKNNNRDLHNLIEKKINTYKSSNDPTYKAAAEILAMSLDELQLNEDEIINKVMRQYRIDQTELVDRFENYKISNMKELESEFNKEFTEETSIRGFKVRGTFEDENAAREQAKESRSEEPYVHTFIGPVGYWTPWDPSADAVQDQDYMVSELNDLMAQKKANEEQKNIYFEKRKQMMMESDARGNELHNRLKDRLNQQKASRQKK